MTTQKRQIANKFFIQFIILFALGFSIVGCTNIEADIFGYPYATLYEGNDAGSLWKMILPPTGGLLTTYEGKAYTTTSSMDEILLYYQRSLSEWNYLGQDTINEGSIERAMWEKNNDKIGIYYLSLSDRPCCFLLVSHTHFQRPLITTPFPYIGLVIILLTLLFVIFRKRLQKK